MLGTISCPEAMGLICDLVILFLTFIQTCLTVFSLFSLICVLFPLLTFICNCLSGLGSSTRAVVFYSTPRPETWEESIVLGSYKNSFLLAGIFLNKYNSLLKENEHN